LVDWSNVSLTGERVNNDGNTFIGGGQIGYNWQISHFILGLEGSLSGTNPVGNAISIVDPAFSYRTSVHALGTVTGRVGFAAQRVLIYAKGGWAIGRDEFSGHIQTTNDSFSIANTKNGWTVGTGFEFMFWNGWSAGLDYSYVDLGSESLSGTTALGLPFTIRDIDTRIHFLSARINFY
jgi:outer membrane immunogenic protein